MLPQAKQGRAISVGQKNGVEYLLGDRRECVSASVSAVAVCIGFSAVVAQIVLMRELIVVFSGNEMSLGLMLAIWLLWTAFGGGIIGARRPPVSARVVVATLQVAMAIVLPVSVVAIRATKVLFHVTAGEMLGPGAMLLTSVVSLAAFCTISGWLFAAASRLFVYEKEASAAVASGTVYLLEAVGSGFGGLLASLLLIRNCSPLQIAFLIGLINLLCAAAVGVRGHRLRWGLMALTCVAVAFTMVGATPWLERTSLDRLWRGFHVVAWRDSPYGHLDVVESQATRSLYENGLVAAHAEDPAAAEEAVHFALLQHAAPRTLLLIGGGINGSLAQALQHPMLERIDYVELDPAIISLTKSYFPQQAQSLGSSRVLVHNVDGRRFLKTTRSSFDVIIVNLPEPQTAQLNRFYTREFFAEAAQRLNPDGLLSFQLRGAEDYISPELGDFLRCINATLRTVFADVAVIPGDTIHFMATNRAGTLVTDAAQLLSRLHERRIHASYVREYYLPYRMMPERMHDLEREIRPQHQTSINRDLSPTAYYFNVTLWSAHFGGWYRRPFLWLATVKYTNLLLATILPLSAVALLVLLVGRRRRSQKASAGFCVAGTGFTLIALEILLLLGFQAIYGYVYHQLALLIASFMVGMAAGSWLALRRPTLKAAERWTMPVLQAGAAISPLAVYIALRSLQSVTSDMALLLTSYALFPAVAIVCGLLGGYQFQVASRAYFQDTAHASTSPAALYSIDLAGACLGAILLSGYLIPVFGMAKTAWLIAAVNLAPTLAALPARAQAAAPPDPL